MKIMVIGSEGYVGSLLCLKLSIHHEVLRVDKKLGTERKDVVVPSDIEAVVDLAAHAHHVGPYYTSAEVVRNNALEPRALIENLAHNVHYVIPSSMSVFAQGRAVGAYPASKRTLERMLLCVDSYPSRISIPRFGTLFGATVKAAWREHLLLNSMCLSAVKEGVVRVAGDGSQGRPVFSLSDAVEKLICLIEGTEARGEITNNYTVCGTLKDYAELVAGLTGARIEYTGVVTDNRSYAWGKWIPGRIEGAVRRLIDWIESEGSGGSGMPAVAFR